MIFPLILIPSLTLIFIICISFFHKASNVFSQLKVYGTSLALTIKLLTLLSLNISLAYSAYLWKMYPKINFDNSQLIYPSNSFLELHHSLGLPFIILSTFILIISLLTAWYSSVNSVLLTSLFLILEICLVGSFSANSLFLFLLFFEASALPVFILIVYCGSPRRERLKASYYFLFFTLYGSISLLLVLLNIYSLKQIDFIDNHLSTQSLTMWVLLFIAFAVKIPLFPFHLWLPYAHVEASTASSIILAALMLKLGSYGVIRFMLPLFSMETHLFFRPLALLISVIGVIYGGIAALRQIDLKRQIAFSSISHMSFATVGIFTFTEVGIKGAIYLMLSHGLTSAALFFLIGVLSDRYHTRSIMVYSGLLGVMPIFSFFLIFASLANVGFPGTSGFVPELLVLISIVSTSPFILFPVLLGMLLTTASTLVLLLRLLFGHLKTFYFKSSWVDITKLEFFVLFNLSFWMLILGMYDILQII